MKAGGVFKKYPGRICRRYEERRQAVLAVRSGEAVRQDASPQDIKAYVDAIICNKTAYFGVTKLCKIDLDGIEVNTTDFSSDLATGVPEEAFPMTLLSFAVLIKRDQVVSSLLRCGADPSLRALPAAASGASGTGGDQLEWVHDGGVLELIPKLHLAYAVFLASSIVGMRLDEHRRLKGICGDSVQNDSISCAVCSGRNDLLTWASDGHVTCETCLWTHLVAVQSKVDWGCNVCFNVNKSASSLKGECDGEPDTHTQTYESWVNVKRCNAKSKESYLLLDEVAEKEIASSRRRGASKRGATKFKAKTLTELAASSLGHLRSTRQLKFVNSAQAGDNRRMKALIHSGVDIDGQNEYGQTVLALASYYGRVDIVDELLWGSGATVSVRDNSGMTALDLANYICDQLSSTASTELFLPLRPGYQDDIRKIVKSLSVAAAFDMRMNPAGLRKEEATTGDHDMQLKSNSTVSFKLDGLISQEDKCVQALIDNVIGNIPIPRDLPQLRLETVTEGHPGSGSFMIDNGFSLQYLAQLRNLWQGLPAEPKCDISGSCRSYYFDSKLWVGAGLSTLLGDLVDSLMRADGGDPLIENSFKTLNMSSSVDGGDKTSLGGKYKFRVLPTMRFLHYTEVGGYLPAHVDLSRTEIVSGKESTHTFILYLSDCSSGGETVLLDRLQLSPESARRAGDIESTGQVSEKSDPAPSSVTGGRIPLARVQPRSGRLLVFPHLCPHMGNTVECVPKLLLRGELLLEKDGE